MKEKKRRKLPEGWVKSKLSDLAVYINGKAFRPEDWDKEGIPIIRIENLTDENASFNYYKGDCEDKYKVTEGELLVSWSATLDVFIWEKGYAYLNQHIFKVVPFDKKINKQLLYFVLKYSMNELKENIHGATMQHITKPKFDNFELTYPKQIADQIRIANELERKMTEVNKMRAFALRQKEAVAAVQGAILREVFPYKEGDKLPEGWRWETFENIFSIDNKQIDQSNPNFYTFSFVGMDNIEANTRRFIPSENSNESGESACFLFNDKYILYGKLRPYLNKVYLPDRPGRCSMELLPLLPRDGYDREFVALLLQSERVISYSVKHSKGVRMPRANMDKLMVLKVPIPSEANERICMTNDFQRKRVVVDKMREAADKQLEAIESLPGAILREVFDFGELQED